MIATKASTLDERSAPVKPGARHAVHHRRLCTAALATALLLDLGACGRAEAPSTTAADACAASADACAASPTAPAPAPSSCDWDPVFGLLHCQQSGWWLEFSVNDPSVTALTVEISGPPPRLVELPMRIDFADGVSKFGGVVDAEVPSGTAIRLKATQSASAGSATASSAWFGYREEAPTLSCRPCAPNCPAGSCFAGRCLCTPTCPPNSCGSDGCGGSCGRCAGGTSCEGNQCVCVPRCAPGHCGPDGCGGTCACTDGAACTDGRCITCTPQCSTSTCGGDGCGGTCGRCAPGTNCVGGQCVACVPSCAPGSCGGDGCGGLCGSCNGGSSCVAGLCVSGCVAPWNPRWTQGTAGEWWAEFEVIGGGTLPRAVSVEVVGGATAPLNYGWGRWTGRLNNVATGTLVILHATDALGATAQTVPFRYLVDTAPLTDQCRGTLRTSTTCQPLSRGLVTLTIDDSGQSQADLAVPLLRKYGLKATFYQVPPWLTWIPLARTLAVEGHETGAHTMTHRSLTSLSPQEVDDELRLSQQWLETNVSAPVESFACPSGAYNAAVIAAIKPYFRSHRTTVPGMNSVGSDVYELSTDFVTNTSTVAGVCAQLAEAAALQSWLILTFHDFTAASTATEGFTCPASVFEGILACAKNTPGLDVVTTRQAVAAIRCGSP